MAAPTPSSSSPQLRGRYCLVSCIPAPLRSADLRSYFSQSIEAGAFACFHYRHRPERGEGPGGPLLPGQSQTCCCLVAVRPGWSRRLVRMYSGKRWIDVQGETLPGRCLIRRVRISPDTDIDVFSYKTKKELHRSPNETLTQEDLKRLPELNPPAFMPCGNVGTPLKVFLDLIKACRMPSRAIKKLQLRFPKTGSSRRYGNVPFTYEETERVVEQERVYTATGEEIMEGEKLTELGVNYQDHDTEGKTWEDPSEDAAELQLSEDDDRCEEWERHEALHEDVTSQERTKERLYEEEIELKWEKGGSGLVFYTDAQYWQEAEGGEDFDEQTADDWDVDMSVYYDKDGGDKDARDLVKMRYEQRLRDGLEAGSVLDKQIGNFEKYTKGIGRKLMEKQGWTEGLGLGSSNSGIPEALDNDGQNPKCKRGLGYHGEKLQTFIKPKKSRGDNCILISTIYDDPHPEDAEGHLLRRELPVRMKYRQDVAFVHADRP